MSGFRALRDVSINFENELRKWNSESFSANTEEKFEDVVTKKLRDMKLFSSKLRLLRANPLALTPEVQEQSHEKALQNYGDTATWKVLEHVTVKSLTQAHAVKALITTSDANLDPGLIGRKEAILKSLAQYCESESELRKLDVELKKREAEYAAVSAEWAGAVETLRDTQDHMNKNESGDRGPLYVTLNEDINRLEKMRWLIGRLVCARSRYDWLADPNRRLSALALTRADNTIEIFTQD